MIYNRSPHPVEVKKISIRMWTLRNEIEAAIGRRIKECEAAGVPLYIDDIKNFYNMTPGVPLTDQSNVLQLPTANKSDDGINSLMESLAPQAAPEEKSPEAPADATPEGQTAEGQPADSKTFTEAEEIIAEQKLQGLDTNKPNPILQRPYQRQAPDLNKVSYGFSLLSDINMEHFLTFTKDNFLQGQSVIVEFLIPQNFMMTAEINYCHHYARTSRIISSAKPDFRVQCKFKYEMTGERDNLRNFLKSVQPNLPEPKKKAKKESEEDSLGF